MFHGTVLGYRPGIIILFIPVRTICQRIFIQRVLTTKGLFCRLLLLTNLYSPDQWSRNVLRPVPMLADKSMAIGSENFDGTVINSQWPILTEAGSSRQEDNRKPIKKKAKHTKIRWRELLASAYHNLVTPFMLIVSIMMFSVISCHLSLPVEPIGWTICVSDVPGALTKWF